MDRFLLLIGLLLAYEVNSQDPSLTITPNPVEGESVEITCSYTKEGSVVTVDIFQEKIYLCRYLVGTIVIDDAFGERIEHTPQNNYNDHITITLTNVTREDSGIYKCEVAGPSSRKEATSELEVYVPPQSMRVFMSSSPPYTENKQYWVNCTFSVYPFVSNDLWPHGIVQGDTRHRLTFKSDLKDGVYDVTSSVFITLTKEDNGRNIACEVTWKRTGRRYSAQLETPLNVTFSATNSISMSMNGNLLVENNSTSSPTCTWGSANPPKPITWIFKDSTVSADNLPSTSHYEEGEFHGQTTVSRLTVTRELNQRAVSCCVRDGPLLKKYCASSGVLDVNFPPRTATITASGTPIVGETINLTCSTDSSHPQNNITWDLPSHRQTDPTHTPVLMVKPGEFGGNITTSTVAFVVREDDFLEQFHCNVIWNGIEISGLMRTHVLGATTMTPPSTITTGEGTKGNLGGKRDNQRSDDDNTNLIIGLAVGLGGGVILITVILAVVIVRGKRRKQRQQDRADNAGDKNPETAHDYETVDEELNKVPDESKQISMIEPDYAHIGIGNAHTETKQKTDSKPAPPVSDPPKSPPETLSHDDEIPMYSQINKSPSRRLPDVVSPGDDPDSDEESQGPPVSERLGEPAIVPAEAEQPPTDEQKHPEIKKSKPVVDKSKKPRKPGKKPEDPYSEIGDRTPNVVTQKSEPNYAEINPSQKKNVVPTPTERTEYNKVDFSQDHENDEDVTGDTDSD